MTKYLVLLALLAACADGATATVATATAAVRPDGNLQLDDLSPRELNALSALCILSREYVPGLSVRDVPTRWPPGAPGVDVDAPAFQHLRARLQATAGDVSKTADALAAVEHELFSRSGAAEREGRVRELWWVQQWECMVPRAPRRPAEEWAARD